MGEPDPDMRDKSTAAREDHPKEYRGCSQKPSMTVSCRPIA